MYLQSPRGCAAGRPCWRAGSCIGDFDRNGAPDWFVTSIHMVRPTAGMRNGNALYLNGGTGATTRVLIESRDGGGNRWFTVGVSPNIVEASFQALSDAIIYKLVRNGVEAA